MKVVSAVCYAPRVLGITHGLCNATGQLNNRLIMIEAIVKSLKLDDVKEALVE